MGALNAILDGLLLRFLDLFSWAPPAFGLAVLACLVGLAMLWLWGKTTDQKRLKAARQRVWAALLELRLYVDEPAVSARAFLRLCAANLRYVGLALRPALILFVPVAILLVHLAAFYRGAPLAPGKDALVTLGMSETWNPASPVPLLFAPPEVAVTSPAVRSLDRREVSWRIRPLTAVSGHLTFAIGDQAVRHPFEAGSSLRFIPGRSVNSWLPLLWTPGAYRIHSNSIAWIEIRYPEAKLSVFGVGINWMYWFCSLSLVSALTLKRRFGVEI